MKKLKGHVLATCASFTMVILLYSLIDLLGIAPGLKSQVALVLFLMCMLISILTYFTNKLFQDKFLLNVLFWPLNSIVIVFLISYIFKIFPFEIRIMIIVVTMIIISDAFVWILLNIKERKDVKNINISIEKNRGEEENE